MSIGDDTPGHIGQRMSPLAQRTIAAVGKFLKRSRARTIIGPPRETRTIHDLDLWGTAEAQVGDCCPNPNANTESQL